MAGDGNSDETLQNPSEGWKERIFIPTILAGIIGGGAGLISKRRKAYGVANLSATYATNLSIVTGCYCGARELVRETRASTPDDLVNSMLGGFASGAILGRLQGGPAGAVRYSIVFAIAGTVLDFAAMQLQPFLQRYRELTSEWRLPEWSPIQVLDEEAAAAKRAREQQLYAQKTVGKLSKEES